MTNATTTIVGNIVKTPERRTTRNGESMASFRVAADRRYKGDDGNWYSRDQVYIGVNCYGTLADNVLSSLSLGTAVVVSGRIITSEWEDKKQKKQSAIFLKAHAVGPNLAQHGVKVMARAKPIAEPAEQLVAPAQAAQAAQPAQPVHSAQPEPTGHIGHVDQPEQQEQREPQLVGAGVGGDSSGSFYPPKAEAPM
ncbi:single-stranded DNA-binding protein [Corynebacterium ulceribovis]|uniref:single-stranded DNA-binding protein n=1 Tax=Corynebacterium ulceribovis TaxID=487732 RepID=UPI0003735846|nr:single-stranded DNA-binding protein [Corynebacterium ulceribovis]